MRWPGKQGMGDVVALVLAAIFPFGLRLALPGVYHRYDVQTLASWIPFTHPFRSVYLTDCFCNYPIIGLASTTGVLRAFGGDVWGYLLVLAAFETLNVVLVYVILSKLRVGHPGWWTLVFAVVPSTWAGGALWGQIDHLGLSCCLVVVACLVLLPDAGRYGRPALGFLIGLAGYCGLFLKQLMVFPLAALALAFLVLAWTLARGRWVVLFAGGLGVVLPFLAVEAWVRRGPEYAFTHYQRVLATGSDHMNSMSGNGPNLWILGNDMGAPAINSVLGPLSAQQVGLAAFAVLAVVLTVAWLRTVLRLDETAARIGVTAAYVALFNAAFNLVLTGVHERYFFYGYPFLLLALALSVRRGVLRRIDLAMFGIGASTYGLFVLAILQGWLKVGGEHVTTPAHIAQPILLAAVACWFVPLLGIRAWQRR